jgi:hypothetical protein
MHVPSEWALGAMGLGAPEQLTVFAEDGAVLNEALTPAGTLLVVAYEGGATEATVTWTGGVEYFESCFPVDAQGNPHTCSSGSGQNSAGTTTLTLNGQPGTITITWDDSLPGFPGPGGTVTINIGFELPPGTVIKSSPTIPIVVKGSGGGSSGGSGGSGGGSAGGTGPVAAATSTSTGTVVAVVAAAAAAGVAGWYFFIR